MSADTIARGLARQARAASLYGRRLKVAYLGDSITDNGRYPTNFAVAAGGADTGKLRYDAWGYTTWTQILSGRRFYSDPSLNFGLGSDTIAAIPGVRPGMASRVAAIIAAQPDVVVFAGGTNDDGNQLAVAASFAAQKTICQRLTAAGIRVVLVVPLPRNGWSSLTSAQILFGRQQAAMRRRMLYRLAQSRDGLYLFDPTVLFQHPGQAGLWDTSLFVDGLHPNNKGAFLYGRALAQFLGAIFPGPQGTGYAADLGFNPADTFDAAANPLGNMLANPTLQGSAAIATTYWSGVVPTGWSATNANGSSTGDVARGVGSQIAVRPDGNPGTQFQMAVSNGGATSAANGGYGRGLNLYQTVTTGIAPGSVMQGRVAVDVGASAASVIGVRLQCRVSDAGAATILTVTDGEPDTNGPLPDGVGWSGVLETPPFTVPPTGARVVWTLDVLLDQTVAPAQAVVQPKYAFLGRVASA